MAITSPKIPSCTLALTHLGVLGEIVQADLYHCSVLLYANVHDRLAQCHLGAIILVIGSINKSLHYACKEVSIEISANLTLYSPSLSQALTNACTNHTDTQQFAELQQHTHNNQRYKSIHTICQAAVLCAPCPFYTPFSCVLVHNTCTCTSIAARKSPLKKAHCLYVSHEWQNIRQHSYDAHHAQQLAHSSTQVGSSGYLKANR